MWVVRISLKDEEDRVSFLAEKFDVTILGYPLSVFKKNNEIYLSGSGLLIGEEKNKKAFARGLKKEKEIKQFEINGDFFTALMRKPKISSSEDIIMDPSFFYVKPITILPTREEILEFASWDRDKLMKKVEMAQKKYGAKLLKIEQKKLGTLSIFNFIPEITKKQKQAIEIALDSGYYACPRKIDLRKLAKKMGISLATYQVHLRKAEAKILPSVLKFGSL